MNRDERPSKTRRKREAETLQALGERLAALPADVLDTLELPDRLRGALEELSRISSHEAHRRQRQFIGRLMREVDPAPLRAVLDAQQRPSRAAARLFRRTEHWRDRMLAEGAPALETFLVEYPAAPRAELAAALVAAQSGRRGAPKQLFRLLRETITGHAADGGSPDGGALLE